MPFYTDGGRFAVTDVPNRLGQMARLPSLRDRDIVDWSSDKADSALARTRSKNILEERLPRLTSYEAAVTEECYSEVPNQLRERWLVFP